MDVRCDTCGEVHDLSEMSVGANEPIFWSYERHSGAEGCELTGDQCVIEGRAFYIRCCLEMPILDTPESFTWGVWTSLSESSFAEINERWDDDGRVDIGPHFGWFSSEIPGYPDTVNLKSMVHQRPPGQRPLVELEDSDHPFARHFHDGVPIEFLIGVLSPFLHDGKQRA